MEALHRSRISLLPYPDRGKGSFSELVNFPEAPGAGFEYTCPTLKVTTELQELITYVSYLYIRWKFDGFNCVRYRNCAISRLRTGAARSRDCALVLRNLEIGAQFSDSKNAQRNLEIAQIPRLRRTYTLWDAETSLIFISKNQPGVRCSDPLESSPGSHSPLVNSDSVGIMSSCSLLASPLSVSLVSLRLCCLCFSVSISNL